MTCLVTLALCLSPFSSGGSKKVLPMRSLWSNVGIGLDPDGFSSSLDLRKTVGASCSGIEPSGDPSGDPEAILSSEGSEDAETSLHVVQAYGWGRRFLGSNSTSIDNFLGIMI